MSNHPLYFQSHPVELVSPSTETELALVLAAAGQTDRSQLIAIQALTVALCWPKNTPSPWKMEEEGLVLRLQSEIKAQAGFLGSLDRSKPENRQIAAETNQAISMLRVELEQAQAALKKAEVSIFLDAGALRDQGSRLLSKFAAAGIPPLAIAAVGSVHLAQMQQRIMGGYEEYEAMNAANFSLPPTGQPSGGVS